MDFLNWSLVVDLVLALLILWKLLQGRSQGVVKKIGGLAGLVCAILGAQYVTDRFSAVVSERWLLPWVQKLLEKTKDSLGLPDLLENLGGILGGVRLPAFLKTDVVDAAAEKLGSFASSAVTAAADVISRRLATWLLFLIAALVIYALVSLLFNGVLDPVIRRLPLVRSVNGLLGAAVGAVIGIILAGLLLMVVYNLVPGLSEPGGVLSPEAVEKTYLTKLYFQVFPKNFAR